MRIRFLSQWVRHMRIIEDGILRHDVEHLLGLGIGGRSSSVAQVSEELGKSRTNAN
jgi:hypothetical protein